MTIKSPFAKYLSGTVLLTVFLVFLVAVSTEARSPGKYIDDNVPELVSAVAEPVTVRNGINSGLAPGLCLKAAGPCLLPALFGCALTAVRPVSAAALKINLPRYNPFYVFITTNAP